MSFLVTLALQAGTRTDAFEACFPFCGQNGGDASSGMNMNMNIGADCKKDGDGRSMICSAGASFKGNSNSVVGDGANVTGDSNTVTGSNAVITGNSNIVTGSNAKVNGKRNRICGEGATLEGEGNLVIGRNIINKGKNTKTKIIPNGKPIICKDEDFDAL